jgi:hypothetical protein
MRKTNLRPVQNQTGQKYEPDRSGVMKTPNGSRRSHRRQPQDLSLSVEKKTGGTKERSKTMGL